MHLGFQAPTVAQVCSKIDFFAVDYPPITTHCCASRITAENPDEGFKPTSGSLVIFDVWLLLHLLTLLARNVSQYLLCYVEPKR